MSRLSSLRLPGLLCAVLAFSSLAPASAQALPDVRTALGRLEAAAGAPVRSTVSPDTGLVTFLSADRRSPVPVWGARSSRPEDIALAFLRTHGAVFGLRGAEEVELQRAAERDALGMDHVRFRQVVGGVPVTAAGVTVHLRGSDVLAVNAETLPNARQVATTPGVDGEAALRAAREYLAKHRGRTDAELSAPRLEILNRGLLESGRQPSRLAWFVEARGSALREYIWVDAQKGRLLLAFSQLTDALNREIYNGNDDDILPGTLIREEGDPASGDSDGDLAYDYSGDTYNYYLSEHGRDSYDGIGSTLISTVHHCPTAVDCPYENAFWDGVQMVYGEGFSAADDVAAHELTHAVTEYSANLFYYMQSGALNESFSDMFGETVDLTNTGGDDSPGVRWLMGEDVPGFGALRNMSNPGAFGDPGSVGDPNYYCSFLDGGGVHFNSGVPNHFYALLADGGTFNGETVTGLGLSKAGKIAYRALTQYLLSGSGFTEAADAFRQSCADLVGTSGFTVNDCQEVEDAMAAVELADTPPCADAAGPTPAFCPAGQNPTNVFFDNFESGLANTNWGTSSTVENVWFLDNLGYTTSGIWHLIGLNTDITNDSRAQMNNAVAIPAGARMQFEHFWEFEPDNYDGGVVEYTTNGTTWLDASPLISAGAGYSGLVEAGNPLAGRSAFVNSSRRYTGTQLNLAALAGQNVRFRFRIGTDSSVGWWGWDIDDVRVYQCGACTYSLGAARVFASAEGDSGTVDLTTQSHCEWAASSAAPSWLTVTAGGSGSGKAGYTAAPNTSGKPRSAVLTIGGQTFTVFQEGAATDYHTVAPCRLFDTNPANLVSGVAQNFDIAGTCGIPETASAVVLNITALNSTAQGNLVFYPGPVKPDVSTINFQFGTIRANNATVALGEDGSIQVFPFVAGGGTVRAIADVFGYYE